MTSERQDRGDANAAELQSDVDKQGTGRKGLKQFVNAAKDKASGLAKVLQRKKIKGDKIDNYQELRARNQKKASSGYQELPSVRSLINSAIPLAKTRLLNHDLMIKVVSAQGVRAADANGLSDPYCVVSLGKIRSVSTRVCSATLNPNWNETIVFGAHEVARAIEECTPFLTLEIFDYDGPLTTDDFLGQVEVDLLQQDLSLTSALVQSVPLSAVISGMRQSHGLGTMQMVLWTQPISNSLLRSSSYATFSSSRDTAMTCSLLGPSHLPKQIPMLLRGPDCVLYEEPCIAYALMMVHEVRRLQLPGFPVPSLAASPGSRSGYMGSPPAAGGSGQTGDSWAAIGQNMVSAASALSCSTVKFARSVTLGGTPTSPGAPKLGLLPEDDLDPVGGDKTNTRPGSHTGGWHAHMAKVQDKVQHLQHLNASMEEGLEGVDEEDEELKVHYHHVDSFVESERGVGDSADLDDVGEVMRADMNDMDSGMTNDDYDRLLYYRVRVTAKTRLKGKLAACKGGYGRWKEPLVLAVPVPLLANMQIRLRFYSTPHRTKVGKLVAECSLKPQDVLEQVVEETHRKQKKQGMPVGHWYPLIGPQGVEVGEMRFAVALVDLDIRRMLAKMPVLLDPAALAAAAAASTAQSDSQANDPDTESQDPSTAIPPEGPSQSHTSPTSTMGGVNTGGATCPNGRVALGSCKTGEHVRGASMDSTGSAVAQSPKRTSANTSTNNSQKQLFKIARDGTVAIGSAPWTVLKKVAPVLGLSLAGGSGSSADKQQRDTLANAAAHLRKMAAQESKSLGSLSALGHVVIALDAIVLEPTAPKVPVSHVLTAVFKCGPHWGASTPKHQSADGVRDWKWEVQLPVYEPSCIYTLAVFSAAGSQRVKRKAAATNATLLGRLRVRLSTLSDGRVHCCQLPMLSDRAAKGEGVRTVATASLMMKLTYYSGPAVWKKYLKPTLAERMYYLGVEGSAGHQELRVRELVFDWLMMVDPPLPKDMALQVLGLERQRFMMSRLKLNAYRIRNVVGVFKAMLRWMPMVQSWEHPFVSIGVIAAISSALFFPNTVIPLVLAAGVVHVLFRYDAAPCDPPAMEEDPAANVDEEAPPDKNVGPYMQLKLRYQNLVRVIVMLQVLLDDIASSLERLTFMLSWRDPVATTMTICLLGLAALAIAALGLPACASFVVFWILRPPVLRNPTPPAPLNLYKRLPTHADLVA